MKGAGALLLVLALLPGCTRAFAAQDTDVRVVLADSSTSVELGGELDWSADGKPAGKTSQPTEAKLAGAGQVKLVLGDKGVSAARLAATPRSGYVRYKGKDYRGRVELFAGKDGGVVVLNVLPLEDYLLGVVPAEMPSKWPLEALKAQAVAARTYAARRMRDQRAAGATFDVYSTVSDQVYLGVSGESKAATDAVRQTCGVIATYGGQPITAYFCSDAGGCTKCGQAPYLQAVPIESPDSPNNHWSITLTREQLSALVKRAGGDIGAVRSISAIHDGSSGHLVKLNCTGDSGSFALPANKLRTLLGLNTMKSTRAWVEIVGTNADPPAFIDGAAMPPAPIANKPASTKPAKRRAPGTDPAGKNEAVDIPVGTAGAVASSVLAVLQPYARPVVLFAGGRGDFKLRSVYISDGRTTIAAGGEVNVANGPVDMPGDPVGAMHASPATPNDPPAVVEPTERAKHASPLPSSGAPVTGASGPISDEGIVLHGRGYGHGVGLSQWGAKTLAEQGMDYRQILAYFYQGTELTADDSAPQAAKPQRTARKASEATEQEAVAVIDE